MFQASPYLYPEPGGSPPSAVNLPTWRNDGFAARGRELGTLDEGALGVEAVVGEHTHGLAGPVVVHGHAVGVGGTDAAVGLPVVPAHGLHRPAEWLKHTQCLQHQFSRAAGTSEQFQHEENQS